MEERRAISDIEIADRLKERLRHRQPAEVHGEAFTQQAAVAAILRLPPAECLEVLLIRRAERPGDLWSGHMAFPGGRAQASDRDLQATVVRETREEIGIDLTESAELLGRLDDLPAIGRGLPTGMVISPFVFLLHEEPTLQVRNDEVAEVIWAPFASLWRGEQNTVHRFVFEGQSREMPAFAVEGRIVWGLTWRMINALFELLED